MSLPDWLKSGWLVEHKPSAQEIGDLLTAAERDLADCRAPGLSADWRLTIAYSAALRAATAALAAAGYRASREQHHFRVINSLAFTIQAEEKLIALFDLFRKRRNISLYDRAGVASEHEARTMVELAEKIRDEVKAWLQRRHPDLLEI